MTRIHLTELTGLCRPSRRWLPLHPSEIIRVEPGFYQSTVTLADGSRHVVTESQAEVWRMVEEG